MIDFLLFIGVVLGIIAFFRIIKLEKTVEKLSKKIDERQVIQEQNVIVKEEVPDTAVASKITQPSHTLEVPLGEQEKKDKIPDVQKQKEEILPVGKKEEEDKQEIEQKEKLSETEPVEKKESNELFKKIEKKFLENWTGIIGAIIIVVGIGFLGVFTAINLSEKYRFFLIVLVSVVLLVFYFILRKNKQWIKLGLWLRSMSAALFLLACAGAGLVSEGGRSIIGWIENPFYALVVLCLGIAVNILLSFVGKRQVIASVHLLLSLTALAIAPQSRIIFIIAFIVTLSGVFVTYREKWEFHLLLTTAIYCAYFVFYYFKIGYLSGEMKIIGIICISLVSILSLFVHYRKVYTHPAFDVKPFLTHLFTWIFFCIGVYLYTPRVYWISLPLGAGACLCFVLAHRARALKIRWLFNTDILMAEVIAVIAVLTLMEWDVPYFPIICILLLESIVFTAVVLIEKENILFQCGQWFFYFFTLLFVVLSFINLFRHDVSILFQNSILISLCILVTTIYHVFSHYLIEKRILERKMSEPEKLLFKAHEILCGVIAGFLFVPLFVTIRQNLPWMHYFGAEYLLFIPLGIMFVIRDKIQSDGLGISLLLTLFIMHIVMWLDPLLTENSLWYEKLIFTLPLFLLDIACIQFSFVKSKKKDIKWPGIYLFSSHLFIGVFFIFNSFSRFLPGVIWLGLSVIMLELSRIAGKLYKERIAEKGSPDAHFLHIGYIFIGAFLLRHITVHIPSGEGIWNIKFRLLVDIFAVLIFLYWALSKKPEGEKIGKSYIFLHPLFPELIGVFIILAFAVEVNRIFLPVVWIVCGIGSLFIGISFKKKLSRFRFHSLFYYWFSVIYMIFLISPKGSPAFRSPGTTMIFSLIAMSVQFGYIVFFYKKGEVAEMTVPLPLKWLESFAIIVDKRKNLWIFYPLFISITLFFIRSFDASILTLLLSAECFFVFVVSIVLKENHFRYLSFAGLGACLIRLIIYDLSSSNFLTKAIVCIGVGGLLIGMNALYNKFSGRFKK